MTQTRMPGATPGQDAGRSEVRVNPPTQAYTTSAVPSSDGNGEVERRGRWLAVNTPQGPHWIGWLERRNGTLALVKKAKLSHHLLRELDAWGIQAALLDWLEANGVTLVEVRETEEGVVYRAPLAAFRTHGETRDYGCGRQLFLRRDCWTQTGARQLTLLTLPQQSAEGARSAEIGRDR